ADVVDRQLAGLQPHWDNEYANPLKRGVNTFREFVEGWYDGRLQSVIFSEKKGNDVKRMVSSILAGYAWDVKNPYVKAPSRLGTLAELCRSQ
ncbi:MAG: FAD-dependent oxidoreductase, partial [Gammaproteobacteria bacterium]|nr:FAD-dependent oxidoreductase [Gammaproteobacteria bacterium]